MIRKSALAGWRLHAGLFGILWLSFAALLFAWKASVYAEAVWVRQFLAMQAPTAACYWWFAAACCIAPAIVGFAVLLVQMRRAGDRGRHAFIYGYHGGLQRTVPRWRKIREDVKSEASD